MKPVEMVKRIKNAAIFHKESGGTKFTNAAMITNPIIPEMSSCGFFDDRI